VVKSVASPRYIARGAENGEAELPTTGDTYGYGGECPRVATGGAWEST
jgi:hypothetical protein